MERLQEIGRRLLSRLGTSLRWLQSEAAQIVDLGRFRDAASWRDRADAVSWKRAAVASGTIATAAVAVSFGVWWMQPDIRAHPPRLPTEAEWRANQSAARAMEGDLSPALAAANRSVTP